jgi:mediator of RNA polymerase II transcription subunit 30
MSSVTQQFVPQQQQNQNNNNNNPEPVPNPNGLQLNLQQVSQTNNFQQGHGQIAVTTQPQQQQQLNAASLCRVGQETVQEIISRTQELFQILKITQVLLAFTIFKKAVHDI